MCKPNSQPEPQQRYKDASGEMITVHYVQFNRVTFYRDGYESPCTQFIEHFIREFTEVKP